MNFLFVHNNFPAQYRQLATYLAGKDAHWVAAIGSQTSQDMSNVTLRRYTLRQQSVVHTHPFARRFDLECRRAEQVMYAATDLLTAGFVPDIIMAHSGWGENLPLKSVFPSARIVVYCEFYYRDVGQDVDFDPEFPALTVDGRTALGLKNVSQLMGLIDADLGISPTPWQKNTFPREFLDKIAVLHEGVDTQIVRPVPDATFTLASGKPLKKGQKVISFVARNLEPLRGYHMFMRALPSILRAHDDAEVVIVGGDKVSYGPSPPKGRSWKEIFYEEIRDQVDQDRVHFVGTIPYKQYLSLLQITDLHVYFTYPFVLSWSLLEAMSAGAVVMVSDVGPTRDLVDESCGIVVPFYSVEQLSAKAIEVLRGNGSFATLPQAARARIVKNYDFTACVLPAFERLLAERLGFDVTL